MNASAASTNDWAIANDWTTSRSFACRSGRRPSPPTRPAAAWAGTTRGDEANRDPAVGDLQDEQGLGDHRQPAPDLGDALAEEEQAEVARRNERKVSSEKTRSRAVIVDPAGVA